MGTTSSHHLDPLDRSGFGSSFKRSASLRHSKSKGRVSQRKMDKLRSSFRDSFRRKKDPPPEISKQQQWQIDSSDVRTGNCFFHVKYLGCIEVFESRGMQVCEEALKVLRGSRRRPVKSILFVSGDGLRVVEDDTKGLIVDQTIEKVSFCAPDRNNDRGFSYICRDGTTRRWLCHGFLAVNESGERLSHAVGCAFALCLERKQNREKENVIANSDKQSGIVTTTISNSGTSTTTTAATITITNVTGMAVAAAAVIPANIVTAYAKNTSTKKENVPVKKNPIPNIHSIERPHATFSMLQRQGSFRGLSHLNHASPFKRQLSLKIGELPSNLERTRMRNLMRSAESAAQNTTIIGTVENTGINNSFIAKVDAVSLQGISEPVGVQNDALEVSTNYPLFSLNNRSVDDVRSSLKRSASFTPPATPPPNIDLPHPEQWLGKVSEITSNISELTANISELTSNISPSKSPTLKRNTLISLHGRAHSLGSAENTYGQNNAVDPFDAEWVSEVSHASVKNTNPFITQTAS